MEQASYLSLMSRLTQHFKAFDQEKARLMWKYLKFYDGEVFEEAVDFIVVNDKYAPTVERIKEVITSLARHSDVKRPVIAAEPKRDHFCWRCRGRGVVFAKAKDLSLVFSSYTFRCCCKAADQTYNAFPTWNDTQHGVRFAIEDPIDNKIDQKVEVTKPQDWKKTFDEMVQELADAKSLTRQLEGPGNLTTEEKYQHDYDQNYKGADDDLPF